MLDEEGRPFSRTYPRRAGNLVKKGRAKWLDSSTIVLTASAQSQDLEDTHMQNTQEWVEYFRILTEKLLANDELTAKAIDAIGAFASMDASPYSGDCPGEAVCNLMESNLRFRENMCRNLMEFVSQHVLAQQTK